MPDASYSIEIAAPDDAEAIRSVQAATWIATYPNEALGITEQDVRDFIEGPDGEDVVVRRERLRERLTHPGVNRRDFVARSDESVVGFCSAMIDSDELPRIAALYVLPDHQGNGIGKALIQAGIDWLGDARDIYLNVAQYNQTAIEFYKQIGFAMLDHTVGDDSASIGGGKYIPEVSMIRKASV